MTGHKAYIGITNSQQNLQLLPNNAVRTIAGIKKYEHITSSFKKFSILKFYDLCKLKIAI